MGKQLPQKRSPNEGAFWEQIIERDKDNIDVRL